MPTQAGAKKVNFSFTSTALGITITEVAGFLIQSADYQKNAEVEKIKGVDNETVTKIYSDPSETATLEAVITGADAATALTNTALDAIGSFVTITACTSAPHLVKTNWTLEPGSKITQGVGTSAKMTLILEAYPGITPA